MAPKFMVGFLIVLMAAFLFWLSAQNISDIHSSKQSDLKVGSVGQKDTDESEETITIQNEPAVSVETVPLAPERTDRQGLLLQEIETPEYSDDPYLEAALQMMNLRTCETFSHGLFGSNRKGKIKNTAWEKGFTDHCAEKRERYPNLLLSEVASESIKWVPATSKFGQMLKSAKALPFKEKQQVAKEMVRHALRHEQAHWLVLSGGYVGSEKAFDLSEWLGTPDQYYHSIISFLAYTQLICEWDPDGFCGPYSDIMITTCWYSPKDCGMPFSKWSEKNQMPGIKKDVTIVVNKLKAYARGEEIE